MALQNDGEVSRGTAKHVPQVLRPQGRLAVRVHQPKQAEALAAFVPAPEPAAGCGRRLLREDLKRSEGGLVDGDNVVDGEGPNLEDEAAAAAFNVYGTDTVRVGELTA